MNFDNIAENLLSEFMSKDILYEPLLEARKKYKEFFESEKNIPEKDFYRFKGQ